MVTLVIRPETLGWVKESKPVCLRIFTISHWLNCWANLCSSTNDTLLSLRHSYEAQTNLRKLTTSQLVFLPVEHVNHKSHQMIFPAILSPRHAVTQSHGKELLLLTLKTFKLMAELTCTSNEKLVPPLRHQSSRSTNTTPPTATTARTTIAKNTNYVTFILVSTNRVFQQ